MVSPVAGSMAATVRRWPGYGVEQPIGVDRGRSEEIVDVGAEVVPSPDPNDFQVLEVAGIDLVQGRITGVRGVPADVPPLSLGVIPLLGLGRSRRTGQEGQYENEIQPEFDLLTAR